MARANTKGFAITALVLVQLGMTLFTRGQDSTPKDQSSAPGSGTPTPYEQNVSARAETIRILTLPQVQPTLEEITLQILTEN
ncbi:MAG TPA: hypothetical protein VMZ27_10915 [Candidatus Saccharimonadales bacterium]|nr:hypothetical protein [Candidatus Saccharimonadales bacterium]